MIRKSSTSDVLDSSLVAIKKVCSKSSRAIELSLYQGAKSFIEEVIVEKDATDDMTTTSSASLAGQNSATTNQLDQQTVQRSDPKAVGTNQLDRQKFERFLHELALAVLGLASDTDTEKLRSARIHVGLALSKTEVISSETRKTLNKVFTSWLEYERSRPLRLLVEQAIETNESVAE